MLNLKQLQKPPGAHPIGFRHSCLIDQRRSGRELPVMIWYPAASTEGCEQRHYQSRQAFQRNFELNDDMLRSLPWPISVLTRRTLGKMTFVDILTNAYTNAPLLESTDALPVLIFAPGYSGLMTQNTILMEALASHGYVVMSMGVPDETLAEYPDGHVTPIPAEILGVFAQKDNVQTLKLLNGLRKRKQNSIAQMTELSRVAYEPTAKDAKPTQVAWTTFVHEHMAIWYQDLVCVLDRLPTFAPFEGKLAASKVGVLGMSMGGGLASNIAYRRDGHVAAALSLDGSYYGMPLAGVIETPHMIIHTFHTSFLLFQNATHDAYYVTVADAAHLDFTDYTLLEPVYRQLNLTSKKVNPATMLEIINTYALAFFDKYIRGRSTDAILKGPPLFPNIEVEYK